MTGNKIALDSNIVIEVFSGNKIIANKIKESAGIWISSIVLGELYVGVNRVVNKDKHLQKLLSFLEICNVLDIDSTTANIFGEISAALYKRGKPIPTNDIWIAASAIQHNLTLISRDKHFEEIETISLERW